MAVSIRKEIKGPDTFVRWSISFWEALAGKRALILALAGLALVGAFGAAASAHLAEKKDLEAGARLSLALDDLKRQVEGPDVVALPEEKPPFKTEKEKYETVAKQLEELRSRFPMSRAATSALLYLGDAAYALGHYDEALRRYDEFLAIEPQGASDRVLAELSAGYALEHKKDYEGALARFARATQGDGPLQDQAAFQRGRMLELLGKKDEAAAAYAEVKAKFADGSAAGWASDRLAKLAAQGVKPPAAPAPAAVAQ